MTYDRLGFYMAPGEETEDFSTSPNQKIASKILTATLIKGRKSRIVQKLEKPVIATFQIKSSPNMSNPQCVWWNREQLSWSNQGCKMIDSNETTVVCHCSHLTHFAVIMDVTGAEVGGPNLQEMLIF